MPTLNFPRKHDTRGYTKRSYDDEGNPYKTPAWRKFSYRMRNHQGLCVGCMCYGRVTLGDYVDHVFPWKGRLSMFWENLYQVLCSTCHGKKSSRERRGIFDYYHEGNHYQFSEQDYAYWAHIKSSTIDLTWMRNRLKTKKIS